MAQPRRHAHGQSALEFTVLITMVVIAFIALSRYVQFALAGRVKSGADGVSQFLYEPTRTTTTWTTSQQFNDTVTGSGFTHSVATDPTLVNRTETTR